MQSIADLRKQQSTGANSLATTLRSVELNITEFCNRTCSFCPRSKPSLYPNGKSRMSVALAHKIARDLIKFNYKGRIGIVGFGEPLAHPNLCDIIRALRVSDAAWIEVDTNGDFLNRQKIREMANAGCTHIVVSMYDKDITDVLIKMSQGIDITVIPRHCYESNFELNLVNRIDIIDSSKHIESHQRKCFLPFYKMFVDWNGDVLICDNDWGRQGVLGNLNQNSIADIWFSSELSEYRKHLALGNRSKCSPCNKCDVGGMAFGKESFDIFEETMI